MTNKDSTLTQDRLKDLLSYDPNSGIFTWAANRQRVRVGRTAGCIHSGGYWCICVGQKSYYSHRLAFLWMTGSLPENGVDHIDGDTGNNRWENLRQATLSENQQNRKRQKNITGFTGVYFDARSGKYRSSIRLNGKSTTLGYFKSPKEAGDAYCDAKRRLHVFSKTIRDVHT